MALMFTVPPGTDCIHANWVKLSDVDHIFVAAHIGAQLALVLMNWQRLNPSPSCETSAHSLNSNSIFGFRILSYLEEWHTVL